VRAHLVPPHRGTLLQELYTTDGAGTMVAADVYEGLRAAQPHDLPAVVRLIEPLERDGTLVERPRDDLLADVRAGCYYVVTRDDAVIACAMLKRLDDDPDDPGDPDGDDDDDLQKIVDGAAPPTTAPSTPSAAELGCLVVDQAYRRQAKGDALLSYLERVAIANGVSHLFALSTRTMQWFLERGFEEVLFADLPPKRQQTYDTVRRPRIYRKRLLSDRAVDFEDAFWTTSPTVVAATAAGGDSSSSSYWGRTTTRSSRSRSSSGPAAGAPAAADDQAPKVVDDDASSHPAAVGAPAGAGVAASTGG